MTARMPVAALALAGVFLATYLTLFHYGFVGSLACGTGACETVQSSRWSMLLGLPVALWGAAFYLAVFAVATWGSLGRAADDRRISILLVALSGWGVLFCGYLTWVEAALIHAFCRWCLVSAGMVVVLFGLSVADLRGRLRGV